MPNRRKPFSSKQKKQQMMEKRERKKQDDAEDSDDGTDSGQEPAAILHASAKERIPVPVNKVNQQPGSANDKAFHQASSEVREYDPNRYRLHFYRESKEEIKLRKETASLPIKSLREEDLEMSLQDIYQPGSELDMPKRPSWDYTMSKGELDRQEEKYFRNYVEKIFSAHNSEDLSYFELNLETWRQLWRVMEMSDVFLVIADLRFPVLHFPPTLYKYITEELKKPMILILNKIDFVPAPLAVAWKRYFKEMYPSLNVVLFGSAPRAAVDLQQTFKNKKPTKKGKFRVCFGAHEIFEICKDITADKVDMKPWKARLDAIAAGKDLPEKVPIGIIDPPDGKTGAHEAFMNGVLTIGCIGEPNVGKSSVINALMGTKVVSVSKTPGHTKHFQTIFLASNVRLCDCPGLVFPATAPKVLQILGGIYPIAQVSDPYNVVGYLAAHLPLVQLLKLKHPDSDAPNGPFSALDICEGWAIKRGFFTAKAARPDLYRAANHILRITMEGRICLRMYPPAYSKNRSKFESLDETASLLRKLSELEGRINGIILPDEGSGLSESHDEESGNSSTDGEQERNFANFDRIARNNKFAALGADVD